MALRRLLGWSDGELMRSDSKPCSRLMRQTAAICTVGGGLGFWVLCRMHYGNVLLVNYTCFYCLILHKLTWCSDVRGMYICRKFLGFL